MYFYLNQSTQLLMKRFLSLDVLRGLTVAGMIIVNNPGEGRSFKALCHVPWDGCVLADLVFPFFLFIVGAAIWFAMQKTNHELNGQITRKILQRGALIFIVGLLFNYFPFNYSIAHLRILGVLQRIAIVYVAASFIALALKDYRKIIAATVVLLAGYWGLLVFTGGYTLHDNIVRTVDIALFGEAHLYRMGGGIFDPEGFLSAIPSIANGLLGYLFGMLIGTMENKRKAVAYMFGGGILLMGIAYLWNLVFPFNKPMWTSSYALFTSAACAATWAVFAFIIDIKQKTKWTTFFRVFGSNALFAYLLSDLLGILNWMLTFHIGDTEYTVSSWLTEHVFRYIGHEQLINLSWSLFIVMLSWLATHVLYRKKIYIKL